MGLDGQRAVGDVLAELPQIRDVLGVDGQLVDRDIVGSILGVRPTQDGAVRGIEDILRIGAREVRGEGNVEGVVNVGLLGGGREDGRLPVRSGLVLGRDRGHIVHIHVVRVRPRHAKARAHPL